MQVADWHAWNPTVLALAENPDTLYELVILCFAPSCSPPLTLLPLCSTLSFVPHGGRILWTPSLGLLCSLISGWIQSIGDTDKIRGLEGRKREDRSVSLHSILLDGLQL